MLLLHNTIRAYPVCKYVHELQDAILPICLQDVLRP